MARHDVAPEEGLTARECLRTRQLWRRRALLRVGRSSSGAVAFTEGTALLFFGQRLRSPDTGTTRAVLTHMHVHPVRPWTRVHRGRASSGVLLSRPAQGLLAVPALARLRRGSWCSSNAASGVDGAVSSKAQGPPAKGGGGTKGGGGGGKTVEVAVTPQSQDFSRCVTTFPRLRRGTPVRLSELTRIIIVQKCSLR